MLREDSEHARLGPVPRRRITGQRTLRRISIQRDAHAVREMHPDGTTPLKDPDQSELARVRDELVPRVIEELAQLSDSRADAVLARCGFAFDADRRAEKALKALSSALHAYPCSIEWGAVLQTRGLKWSRPPLRSRPGRLEARLQVWTEDSPSAADSSLFASTGIWRSPRGKWLFVFLSLPWFVTDLMYAAMPSDTFDALFSTNFTKSGSTSHARAIYIGEILFVQVCLMFYWFVGYSLHRGRFALAQSASLAIAAVEVAFAFFWVLADVTGDLAFRENTLRTVSVVVNWGIIMPAMKVGLVKHASLSFYIMFGSLCAVALLSAVTHPWIFADYDEAFNPQRDAIGWFNTFRFAFYASSFVALSLLGTLLYYRRWAATRESRLIRAQESKRYTKVWERKTNDVTFAAGLEELKRAWDALQAKAQEQQQPPPPPQQHAPHAQLRGGGKEQDPEVEFLGHTGIEALFHQADELNPILQSKARAWARATGGEHHAASVKAESRALQKVFRSYHGKWTRLCDLVRTSLVFDTPQQIAACLREITKAADATPAEVELVPTSDSKCRLRVDFDAERLSGGYRDVQISMRLPSARNCEGHIVEVQLHLKDIYNIKTADGHAAYVRARNLVSD